MSESVDHKERAEMWFKRAGELVGEVSTQRATAAAATAMAATATAEATAARAEAAALKERCARLEESLARAQAAQNAQDADLRASNDAQLAEALSALDIQRDGRLRAEEEAEKHKRRADAMRSELDRLSTALEEREREREWEQEQNAAVLAAVRSCPQLELPLTSPSLPPPPPPTLEAPPPLSESRGVRFAAAAASNEQAAAGTSTALVPAAAEESGAGSGGGGGERHALSSLVREVLGGELRSLVHQLESTAVTKAEEACNTRISILETAVGELIGVLDAETHQLLVRWKRQMEDAKKETALLREQARLEHIAKIDLQNALKSEQRKTAELEYHQMQIHKKEQQRIDALGLANARVPSAPSAAGVATQHLQATQRAPLLSLPSMAAASQQPPTAPPPKRVAEVAAMQPSSAAVGAYLQPALPTGYWVGPAWGQVGPGYWARPQVAPRMA